MIVLEKIHKINLPMVVALGSFDSMHLGHQRLIAGAVTAAKQLGLLSVVFTFKDLPLNVISGRTVVKNVLTQEEKQEAIERLGVDILVNVDFDRNMQGMSAKNFVSDILKEKLNCSVAVCGYNYSFGYMGYGNPDILNSLGLQYGFETLIMDEFKINGTTVSSTYIRKLLEEGKVSEYKEFTGRRYSISGKVIEGNHIGNRMGYPTVNLNLSDSMSLPLNGVYATYIFIDGQRYEGVTNVGNKPTVGTYGKNAETHIFGFQGDLYGKDIKVEFLEFMRPEQKFESIEELEHQISRDCGNAKTYFDVLR